MFLKLKRGKGEKGQGGNGKTLARILALLVAFSPFLLSGPAATATNAPIAVSYTNDTCWVQEDGSCLPVDATLLKIVQRSGKGIVLQYSDDLGTWAFLDYWDPNPGYPEREVWVSWLAPVDQRRHHLFFRAIEVDAPVDFLLPLLPPEGAIEYRRGERKRPRKAGKRESGKAGGKCAGSPFRNPQSAIRI